MSTNSNVTLTIAFNDPELDLEERDEQAQQLLTELRQMDEVETVDRKLPVLSLSNNDCAWVQTLQRNLS